MESLIKSFVEEMTRYQMEYNKTYDIPELDHQQKIIVEEAATSFVNGIWKATLYGFGTEAAAEIAEIAEDYDFVKGQTITGVVTF